MRLQLGSPIWGGAALGLVIGLIVSAAIGDVGTYVLWGLGIGALSGVGAVLLGWIADALKARLDD